MKKALQVKYLLRDIIVLNDLSYFLTLTLDPLKIPEEYKDNTHQYITKIFNHFITVIKRKKFKYFSKKNNRFYTINLKSNFNKLKYVWIIEFQHNGNAHLHILLNKFLPIEAIRKVWAHVGGGVMMRIVKVKTIQGISNYVTDYIVKGIKDDTQNKSFLRYNQRRYSISRSCIRPKKQTINKLYPDLVGDELHDAFEKDGLKWVYNTLQSLDYEEKEVIL